LLFKSSLLTRSVVIEKINFDSLISEIPNIKIDSNKVNYLLKISDKYFKKDYKSGIKYGNLALELALKINWKYGIAKSNYKLGLLYESWDDDIKTALNYYLEALKVYKEIGNKYYLYGSYSDVGNIFMKLSNYQKAVDYYELDLFLAEDIYNGSYLHLIYNLENLYKAYEENGEFENALKIYKQYIEFKNIIKLSEDEENINILKKNLENDTFINFAFYGSVAGLVIGFVLTFLIIFIRKKYSK